MATKNSKKPTKAKKPAAKKVTKVQKKPVKKAVAKKPAKPVKKAAVAKKAPKKTVAKVSASPTDFSAFLKLVSKDWKPDRLQPNASIAKPSTKLKRNNSSVNVVASCVLGFRLKLRKSVNKSRKCQDRNKSTF